MKKYPLLILILSFLMIAIVWSCKKNKHEVTNEPPPAQTATEDEASSDAQEFFSNLPAEQIDLRDVILPNGENVIDFALENDREFMRQHSQFLPEKYRALFTGSVQKKSSSGITEQAVTATASGPQTIKNNTILRYQVLGNFLITDALHKDLLNDGKKPEQPNGIAYALGSKQYNVRAKGIGCTEEIFGIDCSGMLGFIVTGAGIGIPLGQAVNQSDTTVWKTALKAAGESFSKIKIKQFKSSEITADSLQTGDIVSFYEGKNITHIGIALLGGDGKVRLFQSNGSKSTCKENYSSANKGPREIGLLAPLSWKNKEGKPIFSDYSVLRLVIDISGDWTALLRCEGQLSNAIEMSLKIPANDGGTFKANGTGTDYTGEPLTVTLEGTYNKKQNELSGLFTIKSTNFEDTRTDKFTVKLNKDETPYFPLIKVLNNNGCNGELKLINKKSTTTTSTLKKSNIKHGVGLGNPGLKK